MDLTERSQDIYEEILGYTKPRLIPLPSPDDLEDFIDDGITITPISRVILRISMRISGLQRFVSQSPDQIERLLRQVNIRGPALYAPAVSATLALADDPRPLDPFQRAAILLLAARSLHDDLWSGKLPPDQYQEQTLEMGQYPNLFATHIITDRPKPRIFKSTNTDFITVLIAGRFFTLKIWGNPGVAPDAESVADALRGLSYRCHEISQQGEQLSPGALTATDDRFQIEAFRAIDKIPQNHESLGKICHSFLTLCLDLDDSPRDETTAAQLSQSKNYDNRWFHASLQIIVFGNAKACLIAAFSAYLDGNVMMRGASEIQQRALSQSLASQPGNDQICLPKGEEIAWQIPPDLLNRAQASIDKVIDPGAITVTLDDIGRQRFKEYNIESIPTFMLALLLASFRATGRILRITQFVSMSRYRCMDLTTTMITTSEVEECIKAIADERPPAITVALLRKATESQHQKIQQARRRLTLDDMMYYYINSTNGLRQAYVITILGLTAILLRVGKLLHPIGRDVAASHPEIYPGIPIVGRPGIRLPYVNDFGLHYQIFPTYTTITWMGGRNKEINFIELTQMLRDNLEKIFSILEKSGEEKIN